MMRRSRPLSMLRVLRKRALILGSSSTGLPSTCSSTHDSTVSTSSTPSNRNFTTISVNRGLYQNYLNFLRCIFTARKRSLGQGNVYTSVCQEFCPQEGVYPSMQWAGHVYLWIRGVYNPQADIPWTHTPSWADTPRHTNTPQHTPSADIPLTHPSWADPPDTDPLDTHTPTSPGMIIEVCGKHPTGMHSSFVLCGH